MNTSNRRVCLINTPTLYKRPLSRSMAGGLGFDGNQSMVLPPLDLAIIASQLRLRGYDVTVIDADALRLDDGKVLSMAGEGGYDVTIAAVSLPTLNSDCSFISELRQLTDKVIAKTMLRDNEVLREILEKSKADFVIHGECDLHIHEIIEGRSDAGTAFLKDGELIAEDAVPVSDLDTLPLPAWDLLPYDKYTYPLLGELVMTMQTSRGCPFPCSYYCPYPLVEGNVWRSQSPERVYQEMEKLVKEFGIQKVLFRDATFTFNMERIHKICDLIIEKALPVKWWCETRVDRLDNVLLEKMRKAGCAGINIGVETGDQKVMESQAKRGLTIEKLIRLRLKAKSLGIRLHFLLSKGFPDETRKSFVDTFELIMKLRPESLGITIMTPYPGTRLYKEAEEKGWIESRNWEDYGGHQFVMHTDNLTRDDFYYGLKFLNMGNMLIQKGHAGADLYKLRKVEKDIYTELLIWAGDLNELRERLSCYRGPSNDKHLQSGEHGNKSRLKMSVIIPTCNRKEQLLECLDNLGRQSADVSLFEVIVVDDGSTDGTGEELKRINPRFRFRYHYQKNAGPGAARNLGVTLAGHEIVAFIGDDIMVSPDFIKEHLKTHDMHPDRTAAVLGLINWPPEFEITPFMEYITGPGGQQFGFSLIKDKNDAGPAFFYTSNISLKKSFLLEQPCLFDRDFIFAAYEDTELGLRLHEQGLRIIYNESALAFHKHGMTLESFCKRQFKAGRMAYVFDIKKAERKGVAVNVNYDLLIRTASPDSLKLYKDAVQALDGVNVKALDNIERDGRSMWQILKEVVLFPLYRAILDNMHSAGYLEEYRTRRETGNRSRTADTGPLQDPLITNTPVNFVIRSEKKKLCRRVSIIVPVFNNLKYTRQCLEAVAANTGYEPYEVVIVDNGSTDGTKEYLSSLEGDVRVLSNETNLGFAVACNQGAKAAEGDYLVFLNNDTVPLAGWLENLVKVLNERPDAAIVGSKLLYPDNTIQHAGVIFDVKDSKLFLSHIYRRFDKDHPAVNHIREFNAVTAACMLVRKEVFFDLDMFDEGYTNGYEDVDFCLKARERGHKIIYNPESVLYHHESVTDGRFAFGEKNTNHFLSRWGDRIQPDYNIKTMEDGLRVEYLPDNKIRYVSVDAGEGIKRSADDNGGNGVSKDVKGQARDNNGSHVEKKRGPRKKIAIVRGANLNKWSMQNYEPLSDRYDITAYATSQTIFDISRITIPVVQLPFQSQGLLLELQGLEAHLADKDIVFSADITYKFSAQAVLAKKKTGCKVICLEWENIPFNYEEYDAARIIKETARNGADHFIAVTERAKEALMLEGVPEEKVDVISMGIDLSRFRPDHSAAGEYRRNLGINDNEVVVTYIGRMVWEKGIYDFVHAAARVLRDMSMQTIPARFIMAGSGKELEALRERAGRLGISNKIIFVENTPYEDIHKLHNLADIFVLPSIPVKNWQEQFGMVLIESMACGKPVISTCSGSIPEVVGDAGILVQPNDHLSLYESMKRLVMDKDLRNNLGDKALARAKEHYDARKNAEKFSAVFEKVMSLKTREDNLREDYIKGMKCWKEGHREEGFDMVCRTFKDDPDRKDVLLSIAQMGTELKRYDDVEKSIREYLTYHPADLEVLSSLAETLLYLDKPEQAEEELRKVLLFDPGNRRAMTIMEEIKVHIKSCQ